MMDRAALIRRAYDAEADDLDILAKELGMHRQGGSVHEWRMGKTVSVPEHDNDLRSRIFHMLDSGVYACPKPPANATYTEIRRYLIDCLEFVRDVALPAHVTAEDVLGCFCMTKAYDEKEIAWAIFQRHPKVIHILKTQGDCSVPMEGGGRTSSWEQEERVIRTAWHHEKAIRAECEETANRLRSIMMRSPGRKSWQRLPIPKDEDKNP